MSLIHPFQTEYFQKLYAKSQQEITLRNGKIRVDTVTEDHIFYDCNGRPEAAITTIAYLRTDDGDTQRPVMFAWNGGPGSASSVLHLECFGPYCISSASEEMLAYGLECEPDTILDVCDLVYMDPVGVGYSRILNEERAADYLSVDGDARSITFAIVSWLKKHQRWNSRIYLCGESYGTIRACRVLEELGRNPFSGNLMMLGLKVSGVILIGSALSLDENGHIIEPALELVTAALPTMAAVNWYHNKQSIGSREEFVEKAWAFCGNRLVPALFAGDDCPDEVIKKIAKELAEYTGVEAEYFEKTRLHLYDLEDFMTRVVSAKGLRVDVYDGRCTVPLKNAYNSVGDSNLPLQVMNGLLAPKLNIETERLYYTGNLNVCKGWNYAVENGKSHMECLKAATERMPEMKVLAASGLYDLCTLTGNTRYQFSHSGIAKEKVIAKEYPGGHGVYSSKEGKAAFLKDVRELIAGK